ncbi:hypothetical protein [Kribbella sp. NBC_00889]|uniref:hypothetical protein n=1 Tax=Kribbella sp. NBC_00889 TaxID=2975974 RepID=UPI0038645656|nr:hypothetical protein OG817_37410 [Kribbella sp. NBC_00889]
MPAKQVRAGTWQGFEKLIATRCGQNGTLLLGIDKDAKAGYLYAVGHANGTATVIKGLGKVNATFSDPVNFRWAVSGTNSTGTDAGSIENPHQDVEGSVEVGGAGGGVADD